MFIATPTKGVITYRHTPRGYRYGEHLGFEREIEWHRSGRKPNSHKAGYTTPECRVIGTLAECAVVELLGIVGWAPPALANDKDWDIPGVCEVRSGTKHNHRLLIRPKQIKENAPYVHLTTEDGGWSWRIHGWLYGHEAAQDKWLENPKCHNGDERDPAWFPPNSALHHIDTLPR